MAEYFIHTVRDFTIETVGDFVANGIGTGLDVKALLDYKGDSEQTNLDRILEEYDDLVKRNDNQQKYDSGQYSSITIKQNTQLYLKFSEVDRSFIMAEGNQVVDQTTFSGFVADALKNLYNNEKYKISNQLEDKNLGSTKTHFPKITVWIWSKTLSQKLSNNQINYEDSIINISPFISSCKTSIANNGGSFSLVLSPIIAAWNEDKETWKLVDGSIRGDINDHVSEGNLYKGIDNNLKNRSRGSKKRNYFYFDKVIQENDVIFIRFDHLDIEGEKRESEQRLFSIDRSRIQFNTYDMIGLVDDVYISTTPENTSVNLNINGRDLMKLFIEDGVHFYPFEHIAGNMFANMSDQLRLRRFDGLIKNKFQQGFKKLDSVLKFIINQISTVEICSDSLFDLYKNLGRTDQDAPENEKDRRSKRFKITDESLEEKNKIEKQYKEQSDEAKELVRLSRFNYALSKDDKNEEIEIINSVYNDIYEFITFLDDNGKLKTSGDTLVGWNSIEYQGKNYGISEFPDIFKNRLFKSGEAIQGASIEENATNSVYKTYISNKQKNNFKESYEEEPLKGIWKIVKLIIDDSVRGRVLADSSIGNEHGSLLNAMRKVCQEPFAEFFGDTYGDQYYITVRKKPFDKQGFKGLLNDNVIIDIPESDIINDNLTYGGVAYSWYRLQPKAGFAGGTDIALAYLKAVYLEEFAKLYGSKPLDIPTNYIQFFPVMSKEFNLNIGYVVKQGMYDLKYMIESNSYLPFIRKGRVTINMDRRIKKGALVRLRSTGEIGYVENVSHDYNIDKDIDNTTDVIVDRVMVEKHLDKYFNICDLEIDPQVFRNEELGALEVTEQTMGKWKVNKEIFNFFIRKEQFK